MYTSTNIYKKQQSSFFIHDYETFGINPALDRPAQFSGIRVNDTTLKPLEKEETFFCRLPNDYLPNPKSVIITNITPQYVLKHGLIEAEFARRIHQIFNVPNTCILGYNNIHFDDEFSRNIFYRNFYDPYLWAYKNGNSRWDLLPVLRTYYSLSPHGIQWPLNSMKKPSFRLQDLTKANHINHHEAHNAISDVYATLELMKLAKTAQPQLFQFLYNHRTKHQLKKIIDLDCMDPIIYVTHTFNNEYNNFITLIAPIALHPTNTNILIAYNLSNNIDTLLNLNINVLSRQLYDHKITTYDILKNIPLQLIRLNACPILLPINFFEKYTINTHHTIQTLINYPRCIKNLYFIQKYKKNNHLQKKINELFILIESYSTYKANHNQPHVDNQLYYGFFNHVDKKIIENIQNTDSKQLSTIKIHYFNTRLKSLFFYYRARNFPDTLNNQEQKKWSNYRKTMLFNKKKSQSYNNQIDTLITIHKNNIQIIKLLQLLKNYYKYLYEITYTD